MGKYTHSKVLTETVDNAVGYIHALVFVSKWDADKATEAAKNRYQLDVITMAVVSLKYKASVVDFIDPTAPKQKAIAQYTIEQIEAHKAEHKDTRSDIIKAADAVMAEGLNNAGITTHLNGDKPVDASKQQAAKAKATTKPKTEKS
jgi:hypothetical protein